MQNRQKIHNRIRKTVIGTTERPRLAVYRSLDNMFAQLVDDSAGVTIGAASSLKMAGGLIKKAKTVGEKIAEIAKDKKIKHVVFDRGGYPYQGAVKALAEAAREKGLEI
ncbi:MAG TPA: 50S ribosomal protein L18 [Candidatus Saccharimonadales bacterium]|nr:50S ribosomal protein L18 [Candidatus Saccharimonadales bacterium]